MRCDSGDGNTPVTYIYLHKIDVRHTSLYLGVNTHIGLGVVITRAESCKAIHYSAKLYHKSHLVNAQTSAYSYRLV